MNDLDFFNGYGGFSPSTGDYMIVDKHTPYPWCNIIANPQFGTLVTQSGATHTWFGNSSLFRISPKIDDPNLEQSGEMLFLKNEATGKVWQPLIDSNEIRHCHGHSVFHTENDLQSSVNIFVAKHKPIKFIQLKLKNTTGSSVNFSATYYLQPVLGEFQEKTKSDIQTYFDSKTKKIYIKNPGSFYYPNALIYIGTTHGDISYSLNRTEFFGRNNHGVPVGLKNSKLPNKNTPANDPAVVIKADFILQKGEEKTICFYIGVFDEPNVDKNNIPNIDDAMISREFNMVHAYWNHLPVFKIDTPNKALNTLINHRLLYQILSSRLWGKLGFWQPGGAFGFRDQLQDSMALVWSDPQLLRNQILLSASRQFTGGDVQHWWHPPRGDGIRTTSSDAALWLVYAMNFYLEITGDVSILDEQISFLDNTGSEPGSYFVPKSTDKKASLYEHCTLAIDHSLSLFGEHGLPLMLAGDWNDSLSKIGIEKKGESVWLAQFLGKVIKDFVSNCKSSLDYKRLGIYESTIKKLESGIDKSWDGNWYARAYWDDGTVLGSKSDKYCRIDGLVQNWSVISGMGQKTKTVEAMKSVEENLIDWKHGEVRLLTPAFDEGCIKDPGYIITYPPGTRENGSTYSHNACWTALAFAMLGEGGKAMDVLDIVNPIIRTNTNDKADLYRGEPYAMAGDIYTEGPSRGQVGWTWYTGSASVYYKTVIQNILGITISKNTMTFNPCVPSSWDKFSVVYTYQHTKYNINYLNPNGVESGVIKLILDGKDVVVVPLIDGGGEHEVVVVMS